MGHFGGISDEIEALRRDKNVLMVELVRLRQQQAQSDHEMRLLHVSSLPDAPVSNILLPTITASSSLDVKYCTDGPFAQHCLTMYLCAGRSCMGIRVSVTVLACSRTDSGSCRVESAGGDRDEAEPDDGLPQQGAVEPRHAASAGGLQPDDGLPSP